MFNPTFISSLIDFVQEWATGHANSDYLRGLTPNQSCNCGTGDQTTEHLFNVCPSRSFRKKSACLYSVIELTRKLSDETISCNSISYYVIYLNNYSYFLLHTFYQHSSYLLQCERES